MTKVIGCSVSINTVHSVLTFVNPCIVIVSTHPRHQPAATCVNTTRYCKYSQVLLMMGENSPKHVELTGNNKLTCVVASSWLLS